MSSVIDPVGPFAKTNKLAENMLKSLIFNTMVFELMDWAQEVEAGLADETLPNDVRRQVLVDHQEIKRRFSQLSGSMLSV